MDRESQSRKLIYSVVSAFTELGVNEVLFRPKSTYDKIIFWKETDDDKDRITAPESSPQACKQRCK